MKQKIDLLNNFFKASKREDYNPEDMQETELNIEISHQRMESMKKQKSKFTYRIFNLAMFLSAIPPVILKIYQWYAESKNLSNIEVYLNSYEYFQQSSRYLRLTHSLSQETIATRVNPILNLEGNALLPIYQNNAQKSLSDVNNYKDTILNLGVSSFENLFSDIFYGNYCKILAEKEEVNVAERCTSELQNSGLETISVHIK